MCNKCRKVSAIPDRAKKKVSLLRPFLNKDLTFKVTKITNAC